MNLTVEQLEELEKVARAATPGPWVRSGVRQKVGGADTHSVVATEGGKEIIFASVWYDPKTHAGFSDAVYIATFDPPTILALLSTVRQAGEVGEGWVLVPREPTPEIRKAIAIACGATIADAMELIGDNPDSQSFAVMNDIYRALISASPSLSSVKGEENGGSSSGSLDPVRAAPGGANETLSSTGKEEA